MTDAILLSGAARGRTGDLWNYVSAFIIEPHLDLRDPRHFLANQLRQRQCVLERSLLHIQEKIRVLLADLDTADLRAAQSGGIDQLPCRRAVRQRFEARPRRLDVRLRFDALLDQPLDIRLDVR